MERLMPNGARRNQTDLHPKRMSLGLEAETALDHDHGLLDGLVQSQAANGLTLSRANPHSTE